MGPNIEYIKAYLPSEEPPEILGHMFWKLTISATNIPYVYKGCDDKLGTLLLEYSEQLREALNQDWDLVVIDDLFWTLGFSFATLRHRLWEKGLLPNSSPKFVVYATAGQTLLSADSVKSIGRNWVSKIPLFPYIPTNQQDYFQAKYFNHRLFNFYENAVDLITMNFYVEKFLMPNIERFGVPQFTWHELYKKCSLTLGDSLDRLGWPLAEGNDIVNVGSHCKVTATKPLTGDLAKFVEDSKSKGTIYIAFGTYAAWDFAPDYIVDAFVGALNRLEDYRFIWGYNGRKSLPVKSHIKLVKWVPQLDVLAHPKTKAFITHGGLKSIKEGFLGLGPVLNKYTIDQQTLYSTIYKVVSTPVAEQKAQKLKSVFLDRPMEGMDTAMFYTERLFRVPAGRRISFVRKGIDLSWLEFLYYEFLLLVIALAWVLKH
uniref:glucuronosyltransferase n=1 Tax=Ditylenchus dipsaci TaxID=166011 RepID=A0A915EME2_9BILA